MSSKSKLTPIAITAKLKARINFIVETASDRQRVLTGAKYLGIKVSTRENDNGTYTVFPV